MFSSFKGHPFVFLLWFLVFVTLLTVGFFIKLLSNWGWKYVLFYDGRTVLYSLGYILLIHGFGFMDGITVMSDIAHMFK